MYFICLKKKNMLNYFPSDYLCLFNYSIVSMYYLDNPCVKRSLKNVCPSVFDSVTKAVLLKEKVCFIVKAEIQGADI